MQLYSLQKGDPIRELTSLPRGGPIVDLAPHLDDFADKVAAGSGGTGITFDCVSAGLMSLAKS